MSSSTTTNLFRAGLADGFLAKLDTAKIAFGDSGHDPETEEALSANPTQTDLNNKLLTKDILSFEKLDDYTVKAVGRLVQEELLGVKVSEAGLFIYEGDGDGELVAIRNFGPKTKERDEVYDVEITVLF